MSWVVVDQELDQAINTPTHGSELVRAIDKPRTSSRYGTRSEATARKKGDAFVNTNHNGSLSCVQSLRSWFRTVDLRTY